MNWIEERWSILQPNSMPLWRFFERHAMAKSTGKFLTVARLMIILWSWYTTMIKKMSLRVDNAKAMTDHNNCRNGAIHFFRPKFSLDK